MSDASAIPGKPEPIPGSTSVGAPFLTVAICTRNRAAALSTALASVIPQLAETDELLIVDNASTDSTPDVMAALAKADGRLRGIREPRRGIGHARNTALAQARGRYVIFFDDDERAEPGWLAAYREFLANPPAGNIGCVGGPYLARHETPPPAWVQQDYGALSLGETAARVTGRRGPAGGNCAYLRQAVIDLGGFAAELIRHEDSEMNDRLHRAGYEVWWLPTARVDHLIPKERFGFRQQMRHWFVEGQAAAQWRALHTAGRDRLAVILGRLLASPFQGALQIAAAAVCLVFFRTRPAARLFFRSCRSFGVWQMSLRLLTTGSETRRTPGAPSR
jgi:glycosyltransferase involved in cell wall biosynthesis